MRYKIEWIHNNFVYGEPMESRGNDEEFPTFKLDDGRVVSVHHSRATLIEEKENDRSIEESDGIEPGVPSNTSSSSNGDSNSA